MRTRIRKIIVTGGAGFIGSEFVRLAVSRGYSVAVVDKLTYAGDLARLAAVSDKISFYKTDICNRKKIDAIFSKEKPQNVIHFAAETHVDRSIGDATAFLDTNVGGTHVLLEAARNINLINLFIFLRMRCMEK
ncbi:MAG: GDP-mannose 4,6-dehydratase [Candidatus Omnitrophota bacterium]